MSDQRRLGLKGAIEFLNHPDAVLMSENARRAFLESKGLSASEIAEAITSAERMRKGTGRFSAIQRVIFFIGIIYCGYRASQLLMNWLTSKSQFDTKESVEDVELETHKCTSKKEISTAEEEEISHASKIESLEKRLSTQEVKLLKLQNQIESVQELHQTVADLKVNIEVLRNAFLSKKNFSIPHYLRPAQNPSENSLVNSHDTDSEPANKTDSPLRGVRTTSIPSWQLQSGNDGKGVTTGDTAEIETIMPNVEQTPMPAPQSESVNVEPASIEEDISEQVPVNESVGEKE